MNVLLMKIIAGASVLVAIVAIGFLVYKEHEMTLQQAAINTQLVAMKQLQDNVARSSATWATKEDLNVMAQQNGVNLANIQKDLNTLNATISAVNQVTINSNGSAQTNVGSTSTTPDTNHHTTPTVDCNGTQIPCPNADPFGYASNIQHLELTEPFGTTQVPLGNVSFDASNAKPWSDQIYARQYNITNVLGVDPDGRNYVYNKVSIDSNGKNYVVNVSNAKFEQEYPQAKFSWWNPRLMATVGGGIDVSHFGGSANAGMVVQVMSYGKTLPSPAISVLQLGAVYQTGTQKAAGILNPIAFNVGGLLPKGLVDSSFVGPSIQVDTSGNMYTGINLSVGF
jgi:hypothetical protein